MKKSKKIITILSVTMMLIMFQLEVLADSKYITSDEGYYKQEKSLWCWLAAAENATKLEKIGFYNQYETSYGLRKTMENRTGSLQETVNAAEYMCDEIYNYTASYYTYTYQTLKNYIDRSVPVILGLNKLDANGNPDYGHMVVVIGYNDDYVHGVKQEKIFYYDPAEDRTVPADYSEFIKPAKNKYLYIYTASRVYTFK